MKFSITPEGGSVFKNLSAIGRGGHLGHALAQFKSGELIAFYPNCSDDNKGHSGNGWMEFKRSRDGGETWSDGEVYEYSKAVHESGARSAMAEKAVVTDNNTLIVFHLICDIKTNGAIWEPYFEPTYARSFDGGHTWTDASTLTSVRGRVYDALYKDGRVLALVFENDATEHYTGVRPEHVYRIYESTDDGASFHALSELSINARGRCYGSMEWLPDGGLIAYTYDINDEAHPDYAISGDGGANWDSPKKAYTAKMIRNPQLAEYAGKYFMHGRSMGEGGGHFVIYTSDDAIHWDEGQYLKLREHGTGCYSNNLRVRTADGRERLMIQSSHAYRESLTNVLMWWVDAE